MYKNSKNVGHYLFGNGAINQLEQTLNETCPMKEGHVVYFIDHYFQDSELVKNLPITDFDKVLYVDSRSEITTDLIDTFTAELRSEPLPKALIGIGGGSALDTAKAVSNLLTNEGKAADYQGWDLVRNPGVYKIGIPTLSGTGAEASRTCVMMNFEKNLKLGMNSHHTIYDQLIMDPSLTKTVPRDQYFYTGMDTYIHCIESLAGNYRHSVGDAFSRESLALAREVFLSDEMMSEENRSKIMIASYLGGCAIANSFVGLIHPFSAGLSVVLDIHHCEANCMVMDVMEEFYPTEVAEFKQMLNKQEVELTKNVCSSLTDEQYTRLYESTIIHEIPLKNALGENFKDILTKEKIIEIFKRM